MKIRPHHGVPLLLLSAAISEQVYAEVTAQDDFARTAVDQAVVINVLSNDEFTNEQSFTPFVFVDDGESGLKPADNGEVIVNNDGSITYTPNEGFEGQDTFEYEVEDSVDYGTDVALVTVVVGDGGIETLVTGKNQQTTASMIERVCDASNSENISSELSEACAELDSLSNDELAQLITQINPEEILMARRMMSELSRSQTQRIYSGQQLLRQGLNPSQIVLNGTSVPLANYQGGAASSEQLSRFGIFGTVHIDQVEHDASTLESGYESDSYGATVGLDYRLRPDLHVGAAFDVVTHEVDYDDKGGELDSDVYSLTGYMSWFRDALGVDLQLGYASGTIDTKRYITIPDDQLVTGDTDSEQWNLSTQVQWTFARNAWTLSPFLRLDYITTQIDAYEERGNSAWLMGVGEQEMDQLSTSLGLEGTYVLSYSWGVWVPGFNLSMISESNSDYSPVEFSLLGDSSSNGDFSLQPESEDSLFYEAEVNSVLIFAGGLSTFASIKTVADYENISAYQFNFGFNYEM
ncbi:autotransporter domain-containing protein [Ketobacter sp.]|uniref:autotransporter outer membrane beta-barrel domain-containing protein n=1 Tax=Ketobacter sp. TaxID=2083498 RepID=UPI000F20F8C0|nr:autotransporter domain-containing protein [Ketobacter sp.]RLU01886.1 MAG: autotransporter domain-containing protein [Ketobacter sp.]